MASYSAHTDESLLLLLQNGDEAAFTEIYHRYWRLLFSIAANKLGNLADAEELVQEVFADIWKRRGEIRIDRSLKSFLAAAVKFQVYSMMAKSYRRRGFQAEQEPAVLHVEERLNRKALEEQLYNAALQLPERCRLVYRLSREEGLSNKEIAEVMIISEKTVEAQMTKALKHLRASLRSFLSFFSF